MWLTQENTKMRSTEKNRTCSSSIRLKPNLLTQIDSASLAVGRTKYSTLSTPRSLSIVVISALQKPCDTPDKVAYYKINHWKIKVSKFSKVMWVSVQISHPQVAIQYQFPKCSFLDLKIYLNPLGVQNKPHIKIRIVLDLNIGPPSNFNLSLRHHILAT